MAELVKNNPTLLYKVATKEDALLFTNNQYIESALDKTDGFIHLSDKNMPRTVASLFFKGINDLVLIEIDADKLVGNVQWIQGQMNDPSPGNNC